MELSSNSHKDISGARATPCNALTALCLSTFWSELIVSSSWLILKFWKLVVQLDGMLLVSISIPQLEFIYGTYSHIITAKNIRESQYTLRTSSVAPKSKSAAKISANE